jgi:hypothetical protein
MTVTTTILTITIITIITTFACHNHHSASHMDQLVSPLVFYIALTQLTTLDSAYA